ncbi:MAG: tripartite tricarboxylate transporter substrate binding protein [Betaproteobacteria bacterium]|jgi:tripartite-type tricarboxylate transporter receptor subunit TctC
MKKFYSSLFAMALMSLGMNGAWAQSNFPNKPIVLINPYAAGGPTDLISRVMAKGLGDQLGQSVVVENKAGGGASIGAGFVAKAPADGYTLLMGTSAAHVVTPMATNVPYDGLKSFEFIGIICNVPNILTVHPSVKVDNLKEFVAMAKSKPNLFSYASAGMGSSPHIGAEMFKFKAALEMTHIPYRGAGPAITDMIAGSVPVGMLNISVVQQYVKNGQLKALAYASTKRSPTLPDVPTFAEAGLAGFVSGSWYSLAAPANTPAAVVDKLAKAFVAVQNSSEFQSAMTMQNGEIFYLNRAETSKFLQDDAKAMQDLIKSTGMKLLD